MWLFRQDASKSIPRSSNATLASVADVYCILVCFKGDQIICCESLEKCLGNIFPLNVANGKCTCDTTAI